MKFRIERNDMKIKKVRIFALFIASVTLFCGVFCSCNEVEYAIVSKNNTSSDGFIYSLYEDGSAEITGGSIPSDGKLIIPATVDGHTVKGIGDSAFTGQTGFYSLKILPKLKYIGAFAFSECDYLAYADLGGAETIGNGAFYSNVNLTSLRGLEGVKTIEAIAFNSCNCLCDFELPETLVTIGNEAFACCISLNAIRIPSSVSSYGTGIFSECTKLTYVSIPSFTEIPDYTFCKCEGLSTVEFSSKLKKIGTEAFRGCTSLMTLTLPKSLKTVEDAAFAVCDSLTTVNFTGSETGWNSITFKDTNDTIKGIRPYCKYKAEKNKSEETEYTYTARTLATTEEASEGGYSYLLYTDGTACVTGYTGAAAILNIPETLGGHTVSAIYNGAFYSDEKLSKVVIGDNIDTIGEAAFYLCSSLSDIEGGKNVVEIGIHAFYGTKWLSDKSVGNDFVTFGDGVLVSYTGKSNTVNIPGNIKHIGGGAFLANSSLRCVIAGNSVCSLSTQALSWCENLLYFYAPALKSVGNLAFSGCSLLTYVKFSDKLTEIGDTAFGDCYALRSVCLGNSIKTMSGGTFSICQNLRTVCVPMSMEKLSSDSFDSAITVIFLYPGSETEFRAICNENSSQRYLGDDMLITEVPEK